METARRNDMPFSEFLNSFDMQTSSEDEMKRFILSITTDFNLDVGDSLPLRVLRSRLININLKQKEALSPAIYNLIGDGIFEEKNDCLILTEKGKGLFSLNQTRKDILSQSN